MRLPSYFAQLFCPAIFAQLFGAWRATQDRPNNISLYDAATDDLALFVFKPGLEMDDCGLFFDPRAPRPLGLYKELQLLLAVLDLVRSEPLISPVFALPLSGFPLGGFPLV